MPTYRFTGESEEVFPDFSIVLQPGETLTTAEPVTHARLELVGGPPASSPKSTPKPTDT